MMSNQKHIKYNFKSITYISLLLTLSVLISVSSCKKEPTQMEISGQVLSAVTSTPLPGVQVSLASTAVQSWVYNANFQDIESMQTGTDGSFTFIISKKPASAYRIYMYKKDYFENIIHINASDIEKDNYYYDTYELYEEAEIELNIQNALPYDEDDRITFRITKGAYDCTGCCPGTYIHGKGIAFDTTINCLTYGSHYFIVESAVTKEEVTQQRIDSVFIEPFQKNTLNIFY